MNIKCLFFKANQAGLVLCAALLGTLTGCISYEGRPAGQAVTVVAQDDYVYYPGYEVYYSSSRHQYADLEGGTWVTRPAPRGVSVDVLRASPSVKMDFHDSPANHHATVVKKYPKNWTPPAAKPERKDNDGDARR